MIRQAHIGSLSPINGIQRKANVAHWLCLEFAFDINFRAWKEMSGGLERGDTSGYTVANGIKAEKSDHTVLSVENSYRQIVATKLRFTC